MVRQVWSKKSSEMVRQVWMLDGQGMDPMELGVCIACMHVSMIVGNELILVVRSVVRSSGMAGQAWIWTGGFQNEGMRMQVM